VPGASTQAPGTAASAGEPPAEAARPGGVFRIGVEGSFNFTNGFDPTGEYLLEAFSLYSSLLVRTLLGYDHVAGAAGTRLRPDLAAAMPRVTDGGRTWTFTLKDGIRFGPPVSREITSKDILYAFERIGTPSLAAQYGFYYDVIEGMEAFRAGKADRIAGIETPDEKTIVFHLTQPTGDFGYRVAMPATGPIPAEVARCFTQAGEYGRYLIASGPYMLEGSENLDIGSCETMRPISGFDPDVSLSLVRNPEYDPATDSPEAREALPDGFLLTVDSNPAAIYAKLRSGELEGEWASVPPKVLREYARSGELRSRLKLNPADTVAYVTMNLTQPPFDDVHVRRAVNLVMDKEGLRRAFGGELTGEIATHILPDALLGGALEGYDPYPSAGHAGDVEAARAQMRLSRYDRDGDGLCDDRACDGVIALSTNVETPQAMEPVLAASLAKLGIELDIRTQSDPFSVLTTVREGIPISALPSWGKDYPDPATFMTLFDGDAIVPRGNVNFSLVGLTPARARQVGASGTVEGIPSVDADLRRCRPLTGRERVECFAELDRKLMEQVVPWVPYLDRMNIDVLGPAVTAWEYDQFSTITAYAHVAVDAARQRR
jgi:peptide/nickel transport system substrate-binding protein